MKRNNFIFGILLGVVAPLVAHLFSLFTDWAKLIGGKEISLYVIAALLNLLLVRYYYRNTMESTARGLILITFLATIVLIFTKNLSVAN